MGVISVNTRTAEEFPILETVDPMTILFLYYSDTRAIHGGYLGGWTALPPECWVSAIRMHHGVDAFME